MKKIKIAHIHVWDKKNKGDFGIVLAVKDLLKENLNNFKIEFIDFPIEFLREGTNEDIKKINNCNIVVLGGGGIFYKYFMPFNKKIINNIKKPLIIFGVGYIKEIGTRKMEEKELESIVFLCQKAKVVSFRDNYTKNFLVQKGLAGKEIDVIGDPAVLLNEEKDKKIKISKDKINIGLNLNYSGWLGFGWWQNKIIQSYNVIIKYYQKNNADIYYMVHHPGEYKILNNLNNVKIIDVYPKKQKYIYSKMDIIIGMMLHSCVMSFGALTPEINLAYDIRNFNFANFIKCPELAIAPN